MASNTEQMRSRRRSFRKDLDPIVDKENIGYPRENRTNRPSSSTSFPSENSSAKPKVYYVNNSTEQAPRAKGLQELDQTNNRGAIPKPVRRQTSNSTPGIKPIVRPYFQIYDDNQKSEPTMTLHRKITAPKKLTVRFNLPKPTDHEESMKNSSMPPNKRLL